MWKKKYLGLIGTLCLTSSVFAVERTVSSNHIMLGEWELVPTFVGTRVESFLGLRNDTTVVGSNVTAVWFKRTSDRTWLTYAWYEQNNLKSIAHVKSVLQLSDSTDANWPDPNAQQGVDPSLAVEPDMFGTGVFVADPFSELIATLPDPSTFIELLTTSGWSSADITIQTANTLCTQEELLSSLAAIVETDKATQAGGALIASISIPDINCSEWRSTMCPLSSDGTLPIDDMSAYLGAITSVDPADAWQSITPGTVFTGEQTVVLTMGGHDESGLPYVASRLVITLEDRDAPEVEYSITGDVQGYLSPYGTHTYYIGPVSINIDATAIDSVDPNPTVAFYLNGEPFTNGSVISQFGWHNMAIIATDARGNVRREVERIEIRQRKGYSAELYTADVSTVQGVAGIEQVSITVRLTSDLFDIKTINTTALSLWFVEEDGTRTRRHNGSPASVNYEDCYFELSFVIDLSDDPLSSLPSGLLVTGLGELDTPEEYDYYAIGELSIDPLPFVSPCIDATDPPMSAASSCHWVVVSCSQQGTLPRSCDWRRSPLVGYPLNGYEVMRVFVWCSRISGSGFSRLLFVGYESATSVCSEVNAGIITVYLQGENCCTNCTISVLANPHVSGRVWIEPTATAIISSAIAVQANGFGTSASGGASLFNYDGGFRVLNGTLFAIPPGQLYANYETSAEVPLNRQFQGCSLDISVGAQATLDTFASTSFNDYIASAYGNYGRNDIGLIVSAQTNCGPGGAGGMTVIIN